MAKSHTILQEERDSDLEGTGDREQSAKYTGKPLKARFAVHCESFWAIHLLGLLAEDDGTNHSSSAENSGFILTDPIVAVESRRSKQDILLPSPKPPRNPNSGPHYKCLLSSNCGRDNCGRKEP